MSEDTREAIKRFLTLKNNVEVNEGLKDRATKELDALYPLLIQYCPHLEAIDHRYHSRSGVYRVCTTCGLEDRASEGGTPGDEYDYGYPGSPNREFWKNTEIRVAESEAEHWKYRKSHGYRIVNGAVNE
jgi:hypothetical protein